MSIAFICFVLLFVWVSETRVDAYLDPGSGSMLVQLLLGGIAGVAVIFRLGWQRFRDMFRSPGSKPEGHTKSHE